MLLPASVAVLVASQWREIARYLKISNMSRGDGHPQAVPVGGKHAYKGSGAADGTGNLTRKAAAAAPPPPLTAPRLTASPPEGGFSEWFSMITKDLVRLEYQILQDREIRPIMAVTRHLPLRLPAAPPQAAGALLLAELSVRVVSHVRVAGGVRAVISAALSSS